MIKLSFVVATFNCVAEVATFAETVAQWEGLPVEFCVADGLSTDGTVEALRQIPGIRIVASERDRGIYDAWNKAVAAAAGTYLAFIGIDDRPSLEFYRQVQALPELSSHERLPSLIFGDAVLLRGSRSRIWIAPQTPRLFADKNVIFDFPHPGSYNLSTMFENLRFDPSFKLAGDFDFYLQAQRLPGFSWKKIDFVQARIGAGGASRSAGASRVYRHERARSAARLGASIAPDSPRQRVIEFIERFPRMFAVLKYVAWQLHGAKK